MTIIEALKSGKPFKRKNDLVWKWVENHTICYATIEEGKKSFVKLDMNEIRANDWEVYEEKPKLTGGLLPCPMCGYNMPDMIAHSGTYHVQCKCGLATSLSKQDSVAAHDWNRRTKLTNRTDNTEVIQKAEARIAELEKRCEMYSKNVNGLQKCLEEERVVRDEEMKKAFEAGRTTYINALNKASVEIKNIESFDEWKKGAK